MFGNSCGRKCLLLVYKIKKVYKRSDIWSRLLILVGIGGLYIANQVYTIYGGDAGDLASAIVTGGIPHPPGYPLYTLLGVLVNIFIKGGTPAWRAGFLSSIPAILTLIFLFDLLYFLTRRALLSLISVAVLAFTYPFWLFSEVVEVFSLSNLFIVLLLWSFIRFSITQKRKFLYAGAFFFGLSLTHHQIIFFLTPALIYIIWKSRMLVKRKELALSAFLLLLGMLPYIYVVVAAAGNPLINWLGPANVSTVLALITRSTYGTFRAGLFTAHDPFLRLWDIFGFIIFALKDFRIAGLILFLFGFINLLKKERNLFAVFFSGFLSYLFFLFYAAFPLSGNFIVGTFERFVLPLYIFIAVFIAFGLCFLTELLGKLLPVVTTRAKAKVFLTLAGTTFFIYPLGLLILNYPKVSILKHDFTAENFGRDILNSVPPESIIIIATDTPLFDSQYVYFSENRWPNVALLHFSKLLNPINKSYYARLYPEMTLPDYKLSPADELESFISGNYKKFPVFSKQSYVTSKGVWLPWGLLFRYYKNEDLPPDNVILAENDRLWSSYHDPLSGSLSKFKSLLLSDVLTLYATAHQETAFWEAKRGYNEKAASHLLAAEKLDPGDPDSYNILSQVYIQQGKCDKAKEQIDKRILLNSEDPNNYLLLSIDYAVCYQDQAKASDYQKLYEEKKRSNVTPLKKL